MPLRRYQLYKVADNGHDFRKHHSKAPKELNLEIAFNSSLSDAICVRRSYLHDLVNNRLNAGDVLLQHLRESDRE